MGASRPRVRQRCSLKNLCLTTAVRPGSVSEQVGITVGEVLLRVGNDEVRTQEEALGLLRAASLNQGRAELTLRGGGGLGAASAGPPVVMAVMAEEVRR